MMSNKRLREKFHYGSEDTIHYAQEVITTRGGTITWGKNDLGSEISYDGMDEDAWDAIEYLVYEFDYRVVDPQSDIMI